MFCTSISAPSAVEIILTASFAFATATVSARICDVNRVVIARPDALSAAELIWLPVDNFSNALDKALPFFAREAVAIEAAMLELTTIAISATDLGSPKVSHTL